MSGAGSNFGAIRITGMRFWGKHGADPGERERDQPVDLDVDIACDLSVSAMSDALVDTVDYGAIFKLCERIVTQESFALLETLADRVARAILADAKVESVTVRARKPRLLDGATPEVELRLRNARS
jgi:7,8-dihydroneopterin aldolase/epimerase/oxygenase